MKSLLLLSCLLGLSSAKSCPGGKVTCDDSATCCKMYSGGYGCCPMKDADCCPDLRHCCKNGYTCSSGQCVPKSVPLTKISAIQNTICPDPKWSCPDGTTCCGDSQGLYRCSPLPDAVCCSDHLHSCPDGFTCDLVHQRCKKEQTRFNNLNLILHDAIRSSDEALDDELTYVDCGGGYECPDMNTCCKLPDGRVGCCPMPNAVCCDDHLHCCPSGTICTGGGSACQTVISSVLPWIKQKPATASLERADLSARSVVCPGGQYQCPDDYTCCKMASGAWGCCPMPQATCCDDGEHCCPHGTTCISGSCYSKSKSFPWFKKVNATEVPKFRGLWP